MTTSRFSTPEADHQRHHDSSRVQDHVLHQITEQDRRSAYQREDNYRAIPGKHADLPTLDIIDPHTVGRADLPQLVRQHMGMLDQNRDGRIDEHELHRAASDENINRIHGMGPAISALTVQYDTIAGFATQQCTSGISQRDVDAVARLQPGDPISHNIDRDMGKEPVQGFTQRLYDGNGRVTPAAVHQGQIGDCGLLATFASMASNSRGRAVIQSMIRQEGSHYYVTLGDGHRELTQRPTSAEFSIYSHDMGNGEWPTILERAVGQARSRQFQADATTPQEANIRIDEADALQTVVGQRPGMTLRRMNFRSMDEEFVHREFSFDSAHLVGMAVGTGDRHVQGRFTHVDAQGNVTGTERLVFNHAYAFDHYDSSRRQVYLRNPWNGGQLMRMPLHEFSQTFANGAAIVQQ